ncbi:hypothetical protein ARTHRO9V_280210 [Arthrobacter sp. 9V]|nr:hypothetical protein ARTHRO9V_280210 [Arthrobacter sp. 9V]
MAEAEDGKKIPNYLFSEKEPLLGFAGLYEFWPDPELPEDDPERWLLTCTVLTTTTQDALGHVPDRSPVIIQKDRFAEPDKRPQRVSAHEATKKGC